MSFYGTVYEIVRKIPEGKVATYGQIAVLAGKPGAARAVGNALHHNPAQSLTPCHRVVNSRGRLSGAFAFGGLKEQRFLLEREGVEVVNYQVDLNHFQWKERFEIQQGISYNDPNNDDSDTKGAPHESDRSR